MPQHGGKLAAKALKEAGVEVIFTLSGGHIMPLYDGCIDEGIKIVDVRHEQAAVHAADSWARCNPGKHRRCGDHGRPRRDRRRDGRGQRLARELPDPGLRRSGPLREPAPRIAAGDGPHRRGATDHQVLRTLIYETKRVPEYIELAIRHAVSGIPGPAYLEIPMDIFMGRPCQTMGRSHDPAHPNGAAAPLAGPTSRCARPSILLLATPSGRC